MNDEGIFANMNKACLRGLPEISKIEPPNDVKFCLAGSGPSLRTQLEVLRQMKKDGAKIMAIRDAHDFLIAHDIVPDYALSVDPLPTAAQCFVRPHPEVNYLISSQSDAAMFEFLKDANVTLWHGYVKEGQREPKGKMLIGGATTSGLRGLVVAYILGYRDFHLFGLDSCMDQYGILRINGTFPEIDQDILDVQIERGGRIFHCNPAMALQAQNFQDLYEHLPNASFTGYGDGLIQSIILQRNANAEYLDRLPKAGRNERISFIHFGGPDMASYRYRAAIPAIELECMINDMSASTLIFSKPQPHELMLMAEAKRRGQWVIADFCDDHFKWIHYQEALNLADAVTCPTETMRKIIMDHPKYRKQMVSVIPDPYEFPMLMPHCNGTRLLWFGHDMNRPGLERILPKLTGYDLHVVSNFKGAIPWSHETMVREFAWADIVIIPATETYKSANRAIESIRQGCFVVAEDYPALRDIPGIYLGDIREGIEWAKQQPRAYLNERISMGQKYVMDVFAPSIVASAWRKAIQRPTTSEAEEALGPDGLTSIVEMTPT